MENNKINLKCPNCNGKYVIETYAGDLYIRSFHGTKREKQLERVKLERMGLYCNPWATCHENVRDYICLNCLIRWNKENKNIIRHEALWN